MSSGCFLLAGWKPDPDFSVVFSYSLVKFVVEVLWGGVGGVQRSCRLQAETASKDVTVKYLSLASKVTCYVMGHGCTSDRSLMLL